MKPLDCQEIYADAEFYEQEFAARVHEIPFFLKHARLATGPVLEVACGTGRLTFPLARAGIAITGLDVSRPMLEIARRKSSAEKLPITWLEQDCRFIDCGQTFGLIFSATNAMQHLHDLESIGAFLTSTRNALLPGGTLILDVFNPAPAKLARTAATRYLQKTFPDAAGREIRVEAASQYDAATQILNFTLNYLRDGALLRTKEVNVRCFYPEELLALCRYNGLEVIQRFGDYDETPFEKNSPKQIVLCRKAPGTG
jgi:2-polyprenyl-3-methyl-5-hydroxy-6-metoxy-1,4-benzoquinol methylase